MDGYEVDAVGCLATDFQALGLCLCGLGCGGRHSDFFLGGWSRAFAGCGALEVGGVCACCACGVGFWSVYEGGL